MTRLKRLISWSPPVLAYDALRDTVAVWALVCEWIAMETIEHIEEMAAQMESEE